MNGIFHIFDVFAFPNVSFSYGSSGVFSDIFQIWTKFKKWILHQKTLKWPLTNC